MQGTPTSQKSGSNAPYRPFHLAYQKADRDMARYAVSVSVFLLALCARRPRSVFLTKTQWWHRRVCGTWTTMAPTPVMSGGSTRPDFSIRLTAITTAMSMARSLRRSSKQRRCSRRTLPISMTTTTGVLAATSSSKPNPIFTRYDKNADCRVTAQELKEPSSSPQTPSAGKRGICVR
jgi:hypothetical protein